MGEQTDLALSRAAPPTLTPLSPQALGGEPKP